MKRFAFVSWGSPIPYVYDWKFVMENFDLLYYSTEDEFRRICLKLSGYEFIWFYFLWHSDTMPNYRMYPKWMRMKAPNAKIVMQTDVGPYYFSKEKDVSQYKPYIDAFIDCVDWGSAEGEGKFDWDWRSFPFYYIDFPRPIEEWREKYMQPFDGRKDFVAVMSRCGCSAEKSIMTVTDAGFKVKVFTGKADHPKILEKWLKNCKSGSKYYNQLPYPEYLRELGECKLAIDDSDGYNGMSRFVLDCGFLYIPVVGYAGLRIMRIAFPELATQRRHDASQIQMIRDLMMDDEYRFKVAERGYRRIKRHYSVEECTKELKGIMEGVGVRL